MPRAIKPSLERISHSSGWAAHLRELLGDPRGQLADLRRALSYARMVGGIVVQHPEEPSLARNASATEGEIATRLGLPAAPALAEAMMIERDIRLVELTRAPLPGPGAAS